MLTEAAAKPWRAATHCEPWHRHLLQEPLPLGNAWHPQGFRPAHSGEVDREQRAEGTEGDSRSSGDVGRSGSSSPRTISFPACV